MTLASILSSAVDLAFSDYWSQVSVGSALASASCVATHRRVIGCNKVPVTVSDWTE